MSPWLCTLVTLYVAVGLALLIGIALGSDIKRWLDKRPKKPGKGVAKTFGGAVH